MTMRMTLVEDCASVRRSLTRALTAAGIVVRSFPCAEDLLQIHMGEREVDCFLIDVHLSGISGIELCAELRRRQLLAPIVCMSSDHRESLQEAALASGAAAYLLKPFGLTTLLDVLNRIVDSSQKTAASQDH